MLLFDFLLRLINSGEVYVDEDASREVAELELGSIEKSDNEKERQRDGNPVKERRIDFFASFFQCENYSVDRQTDKQITQDAEKKNSGKHFNSRHMLSISVLINEKRDKKSIATPDKNIEKANRPDDMRE